MGPCGQTRHPAILQLLLPSDSKMARWGAPRPGLLSVTLTARRGQVPTDPCQARQLSVCSARSSVPGACTQSGPCCREGCYLLTTSELCWLPSTAQVLSGHRSAVVGYQAPSGQGPCLGHSSCRISICLANVAF